MSDTQQGSDWWQASDGKWYPPESLPQSQPSAGGAAQPAAATGARMVGKTRNPWGVWLLTLVSFGIYGLY